MNTDAGGSQTTAVSDEISLVDLWTILLRRKKTVIAVFLIVLSTAIVVTALMTPIYESRAVVLIGQVTDQLIENPDELVYRLTEEYEVGDSSEAIKELPFVESVTVNKKRANTVLELTARDTTAGGAKTYLETIVNKLFEKHNAVFNKTIELERRRLDSMAKQLSELDAHIKQVNDLTTHLKKSDPTQAAVLAIESGKYLTMKPALEEKFVALDIRLSDLKTKPTQYLRKPTLPRKTTKPRSILYVAVATFIGLFMALFAAFIHELIVKAERDESVVGEE